jgi:hypothetical protein
MRLLSTEFIVVDIKSFASEQLNGNETFMRVVSVTYVEGGL